MKLATFQTANAPEVGIVKDGRILSVARAAPELPRTMPELIAGFDQARSKLQQLEASAGGWQALSEVKLRAPVVRPTKMLAIGLNYASHVAEGGRTELPKEQVWFIKASSSASGPFDTIQIPKASPDTVDYEAELVVVIGKGGRHISQADAPKAVFGYCVGNDVSVRAYQRHSTQWSIAKSFDTHSPFGPYITTADEIPDPHNLAISCVLDGDKRQNSNTSNMLFNVWKQIEYLSKAMTLEPGDIIFTGTPSGVGAARKPEPGFMHPGSVCRCEIERLGYIEGKCASE